MSNIDLSVSSEQLTEFIHLCGQEVMKDSDNEALYVLWYGMESPFLMGCPTPDDMAVDAFTSISYYMGLGQRFVLEGGMGRPIVACVRQRGKMQDPDTGMSDDAEVFQAISYDKHILTMARYAADTPKYNAGEWVVLEDTRDYSRALPEVQTVWMGIAAAMMRTSLLSALRDEEE